MAGHSQFKNIMYRKGAQDAKRAKVFTKIIRELPVAAKTGLSDPNANPRLRAAMIAGMLHPKPSSIGISDLPCSPKRRMTRSMRNAARAM